jgi:anti-sigma factor RsiW
LVIDMSTPSPLNEEDRDDLSAFLDGEIDELGEDKARAIETRMNLDPTVRAEADALRRTWDLLDYLPRPEPSPSFTHRTLDRVNARETARALRAPRRRRWFIAAGWAAALLLAALGGFFGMVRSTPTRPSENDLVRELRLIENLRYYESVDSLDFLQKLNQPDLFGEEFPEGKGQRGS